MKQDPLSHLREELDRLFARGLYRPFHEPLPHGHISFCSNDYLAFAGTPAPTIAAGAAASRLIAGERAEHSELERTFARYVGEEAALAFTSGYAANVGVLSSLAGPGDVVLSDALNHASLIDGARLSRARIEVVPHLDLAAIELALQTRVEERAWVAVESYYSMDADGPDLERLRRICDRYGAGLIVDEAHAIGVLGPQGRGRCAEAGIHADVLIGTLGKAFGTQGAVVAGRGVVREWLWNRARSFVFSTGLAPVCAAAATRAMVETERHPERAERVLELAARLREGLSRSGVKGVLGFGHVVPVVVGAAGDAMALAEILRSKGLHVLAVRPPTVPDDTARLRLTVTAAHDEPAIDRAIAAIAAASR